MTLSVVNIEICGRNTLITIKSRFLTNLITFIYPFRKKVISINNTIVFWLCTINLQCSKKSEYQSTVQNPSKAVDYMQNIKYFVWIMNTVIPILKVLILVYMFVAQNNYDYQLCTDYRTSDRANKDVNKIGWRYMLNVRQL